MPVIKNDNTLLIRCSCYYHVLEVTYDDYEEDLPNFNISVWNQSPTPISFSDRLKLIWRLIRFKNLEGGDVIIDGSDAKILVNFLTKKLEEIKNGKQKNKKKDTTRQSSKSGSSN